MAILLFLWRVARIVLAAASILAGCVALIHVPENFQFMVDFLGADWIVRVVFGAAALLLLGGLYGPQAIARWRRLRASDDTSSVTPSPPKPWIETPADFETWDRSSRYQIWQAACLWAGFEPNEPLAVTQGSPPYSSPAYKHYQILIAAVQSGELALVQQDSELRYSWIDRTDLIEFAKKRKSRPPFLFPRRRQRMIAALPTNRRFFRGNIGEILAVALLLVGGLGVIYFRPDQNGSPTEPTTSATIPLTPSLLDLFMTDFSRNSFDGLAWYAFKDINIGQDKVRIYYNIYSDVSANSKFMSIYIPRTNHAITICNFLPPVYKQMFDEIETKRWAEYGSSGYSDPVNTRNLIFSGRVYLYHENTFTTEEKGQIAKAFRENGASVQFRSYEYLLAVWNGIKEDPSKQRPRFQIQDGLPKPIPGTVSN